MKKCIVLFGLVAVCLFGACKKDKVSDPNNNNNTGLDTNQNFICICIRGSSTLLSIDTIWQVAPSKAEELCEKMRGDYLDQGVTSASCWINELK